MKTTKKDFELFKNECQKWVDRFELNNWKIYYVHEKLKDTYANIRFDLNGRVASIQFNTEWDMFGVDNMIEGIKETAKHEIIHLLIARITEIAEARYVTDSEVGEANEELVRKLEKII